MARRFKKYIGLGIFVAVFVLAAVMPGVAFAGLDQWTSNGPYGGKINSLAISPNFTTIRPSLRVPATEARRSPTSLRATRK